MKTGREENARQELVGPRSNRGNKIQNGRHVNKGKMPRITISLGPWGKLVSTKCGVSELEVDNILFYWGKETPFGLIFQDFWEKVRVCLRTLVSLHLIQSWSSCLLKFNILFYPQSAFYPWSAVCILPLFCSLHFTLSLYFTLALQTAVCVLHWPVYKTRWYSHQIVSLRV